MKDSTAMEALDNIDFFAPETLAHPYPAMDRMRDICPVRRISQPAFGRDQYVVTSHELVNAVFRDNETFSSNYMEMFLSGGRGNPEAEAIYATSWPEVDTLLTSDEPDHTRLRQLAMKAFMPGRIKRMSDLIDQTVTSLIDDFIERGRCDFLTDFAIPLPLHTIGDILGLPKAQHAKLYDWTFSLMRRNGQMASHIEQLEDAKQIVELKGFVAELLKDRRAEPKDDLISDLVTAEIEGQNPLSDLEVLSTAVLLIVGGAETTRSSLLSMMARLTQSPDQLAALRADPALVPKAVEEMLRLDTPGTALWRIARRDTELGGVAIPKGGIVMMRIDGANRDPAVFHNPNEFIIGRENINRHLSFGAGIHYCIGFRLARAQIIQSITQIVTRLEDLRLVAEESDLTAHPSVHTRCLKGLTIAFRPGSKKGTA